MRIRKKGRRPEAPISAQEIACWVYCPEQWRLQYGLDLPAANQASLRKGNRLHADKAMAQRVASGMILLGRCIVLFALLWLLLLWSFS